MDSRYEGKQSNSTRNMKHVNFVPKDVQRILSSGKRILNRKCSTRTLFLKISQYSQENACVGISLLIKMQAFRAPTLLKWDSNTGVFCEHWEIFKNNYFLTNNIGSEENVSSKIKQNKNHSKTQLYEKNLPFDDVLYHFVFFFFSTSRQTASALHKKIQFWNSLTNEQLILDQWKNYSLILFILYLLLGSLS